MAVADESSEAKIFERVSPEHILQEHYEQVYEDDERTAEEDDEAAPGFLADLKAVLDEAKKCSARAEMIAVVVVYTERGRLQTYACELGGEMAGFVMAAMEGDDCDLHIRAMLREIELLIHDITVERKKRRLPARVGTGYPVPTVVYALSNEGNSTQEVIKMLGGDVEDE